MKRVVDILRIVVARAGAGKARGSATLRRPEDVSSIPRIDTERSSPRDLHPPSVPVRTETVGAGGTLRLTIRADSAEGVVRDALLDPDRFVPPPRKRSQEAKLQKRRAVYSFRAEVQGHEERLYLKLYRPGSAKEALDELLFGRRAFRSLHRGLEAERRGIGVALHYGASAPEVSRLRPVCSALLLRGLPRTGDVQTVLEQEHPPGAPGRSRFLRALGRFVGDVHRRGMVHADLKLRNVFVVDPAPRFALIDLDRASFPPRGGLRATLGELLDLRRLLRSMDDGAGRTTRAERLRVLAAILAARDLPRRSRRRRVAALRLLGALS